MHSIKVVNFVNYEQEMVLGDTLNRKQWLTTWFCNEIPGEVFFFLIRVAR